MDTIAFTDQIDALDRDAQALRAFLGALDLEVADRLVNDLLDRALDLEEEFGEFEEWG